MRILLVSAFLAWSAIANAGAAPGDYLVKVKPQMMKQMLQSFGETGAKAQATGLDGWIHMQIPESQLQTFNAERLMHNPNVLFVQPNYKVGIKNTFSLFNPETRKTILDRIHTQGWEDIFKPVPPDNPEIPAPTNSGSGADPLFSNQWGMADAGVQNGWKAAPAKSDVVVAVIDTGVDYTHEDLAANIWRNPGEMGRDAQGRDKSKNGVDDDGNGYVDDVIGWDFASKDNKPYDLTTSVLDLLTGGGNPGHGTHCAGNVGAVANNGKGIAGVAPNIKIMPLRFITDKGEGTTADAIGAVTYAVKMGAKVTSNSWGSEGDDPNDPDNQALMDVIKFSQKQGVLFVAAAGNGHQGQGYDNDTDPKPGVPASYGDDIIVSVAALDVNGNLGSFSNWGRNSVDIGAPGVKVFSTTPGDSYQDEVIPGMASWDGTSMATPHVAGAAALYWSKYPNKTWREVKDALLKSSKPTSSLNGKTTSGGRLDVANLLSRF